MSIDDVNLVELHEAFAAGVILCDRELGIGWDKLNVNGGAIALGHPFGMPTPGSTTLLHDLAEQDKTVDSETTRVGDGQGVAMIVERLSNLPFLYLKTPGAAPQTAGRLPVGRVPRDPGCSVPRSPCC